MSTALADAPAAAQHTGHSVRTALEEAVIAVGPGPLTEAAIQSHIAPHFSRVLSRDRIYLANHSLGRAPDQLSTDVEECIAAWNELLGDAWEPWLAEREAYRTRLAMLLHAPRPDCVIPRTSAAQGLRAVLNVLPIGARVAATRGEFDSVDLVLKQYAAHGRIQVSWAEAASQEADGTPRYSVRPLIAAIQPGTALVIASQVFFSTGQVLEEIPALAEATHAAGAMLLLDAYHALGVLPLNVQQLGADALIGASYKYLRGGPGAGFFYLSPEFMDRYPSPLDCGWFAKADFFNFERGDVPRLAPGGDAWLDATPPVLTWYQARAGQQFLLALGVERLRAYSLDQQQYLKNRLLEAGIAAHGGDAEHGAFLVVHHARATEVVGRLGEFGIDADARGSSLRLCPDCLTRRAEMDAAAKALSSLV